MKGKLKKEEVFSLLKRTTTPTTIYKKQKLDRERFEHDVQMDSANLDLAKKKLEIDKKKLNKQIVTYDYFN